MKFIKERWKNVFLLERGKYFLNRTRKALTTKEKINKVDFTKFKTSVIQKTLRE